MRGWTKVAFVTVWSGYFPQALALAPGVKFELEAAGHNASKAIALSICMPAWPSSTCSAGSLDMIFHPSSLPRISCLDPSRGLNSGAHAQRVPSTRLAALHGMASIV